MKNKGLLKIILGVIFFGLGLGLALILNKKVKKEVINKSAGVEPESFQTKKWQEEAGESLSASYPPVSTGEKFTIVESKSLVADKDKAETGGVVNFSTALKNEGDRKKFLTHICFNHSGGVTFGCLLNVNIDPGQEFPVNGSTMFTSPGSFSVWVTWSQDKTNFYQPKNSNLVKILIQ